MRENNKFIFIKYSIISFFSLYLPNLQSFETKYYSFSSTTSLSLSSNSIQILNYLDVPFTNGEFYTEGAFLCLEEENIECDESIFFIIPFINLVSVNFKNAIINHISPVSSATNSITKGR